MVAGWYSPLFLRFSILFCLSAWINRKESMRTGRQVVFVLLGPLLTAVNSLPHAHSHSLPLQKLTHPPSTGLHRPSAEAHTEPSTGSLGAFVAQIAFNLFSYFFLGAGGGGRAVKIKRKDLKITQFHFIFRQIPVAFAQRDKNHRKINV